MKTQIKICEVIKPLAIGWHDAGDWGTPGSQGYSAEVAYFLLNNGEYRALINNEYGTNQGYRSHEVNGGDVNRIDCQDLEGAIEQALIYVDGLGDKSGLLLRAHQLASAEARAWARQHEVVA